MRQVFVITRRQVSTQTGAGTSQKRWQVFVERLLQEKQTVSSWSFHCFLLLKGPVKRQERDGSYEKAGDRARTGDSLLGRQGPAKLLFASSKSALQADRMLVNQIRTELT